MSLIVGAYAVDVDEIRRMISKLGARNLLIQSPLGLRAVAVELAKTLEAEGYSAMLSNSSCWGACDVAYQEAESLAVDAIIHLGHTPFLKRDKIPTIYVPCYYWNPEPIVSLIPRLATVLKKAGVERIGLGASVQWEVHLELIKRELKRANIEALTYAPNMFAVKEAQVLGCDYTSLKPLENEVNAYAIVGSIFHALGMALITAKQTYAIDPVTQTIKELSEDRRRIFNQRYANITKFKEASEVGVVVSIKPGQKRANMANLIVKILKNKGKSAYIISTDEVNEQLIGEYGFEAYVNTACPRLSIEDQTRFSKPILLPAEALVAVGILEWKQLVEHGLIMFPWGYVGEKTKELWKILVSEAYKKKRVKTL